MGNHEACGLCQLDVLCNGANYVLLDMHFLAHFVNLRCGVSDIEQKCFVHLISLL